MYFYILNTENNFELSTEQALLLCDYFIQSNINALDKNSFSFEEIWRSYNNDEDSILHIFFNNFIYYNTECGASQTSKNFFFDFKKVQFVMEKALSNCQKIKSPPKNLSDNMMLYTRLLRENNIEVTYQNSLLYLDEELQSQLTKNKFQTFSISREEVIQSYHI